MREVNEGRPASCGRGALQTSSVWEGVFTEVIAVSGILYSMVMVITIAFLSILAFTTNIVLALAAICTIVVALVIILAVFQAAGWTLGIVEAIGISILLGASVDYPLHMVESYIATEQELSRQHAPVNGQRSGRRCSCCSPERLKYRKPVLIQAVAKIGPSIVNSAVTTAGSVVFLFFCKIQIFVKVTERS